MWRSFWKQEMSNKKENSRSLDSGYSSSGTFEDFPADGSKLKIFNTLKYPKKLLLQSNFAFPENSGKHILSFFSTMAIIIILFSPELSSLNFFFKKKRKLHIEEKTYAHIPRLLFNLLKSCYSRNIFRKN